MTHSPSKSIPNREVADVLDRVADLLEAQRASTFRVRAYRRGAETCRALDRPLAEIEKLEDLPNIGKSLASAITEYLYNGRLMMLERLEGQVSPEALFATIPAVGEELAHRIHETLNIETLEELELAANDGRLDAVPGFGNRRVHSVRDSLEVLLGRSSRARARRLRARDRSKEERPPTVDTILQVDADYRAKSAAHELHCIAPRRFNPEGKAWLPVYHVEQDGWSFTALFSNSALAHKLDKTRDWVVVFFERDGHEDQCTVVTEHQGEHAGLRVVRGRESEGARAP
jgi:DNA polymerase (family 10)